jgi:single-strand selective monofunctional uracil DNA glycosylase
VSESISARLLRSSSELSEKLEALSFTAPVAYAYFPVRYAMDAHSQYIERFAESGRTLLLGMNPGPFGMAQTGVPFGDIHAVRDWLHIEGSTLPVENVHPKRPVLGFASTRGEGSGKRLWEWAASFGSPEVFFEHFFVWNFCPVLFLDEGGRNLIPEKLAKLERSRLEELCDQALRDAVAILAPARVIGVGAYARKRASLALDSDDVGQILHPSPANPQANRDWVGTVERQLEEQGVRISGLRA